MGLDLKLAWRNLGRHPRRTGLALLAIAGSVFLAVTMNNLMAGIFHTVVDSAVRTGSGHIGLARTDYRQELRTEQTFQPGPILGDVANVPGVEAAAPRLLAPGLVRSSRGSRPVIVWGIDVARERQISRLVDPELYTAGTPPAAPARLDRGAIPAVLGQQLAAELGLAVGNKVVWMATDADGATVARLLRVRGVIRTGVQELDGALVLADRGAVGEALGRSGAAHTLSVLLARGDDGVPAALPPLQVLAGEVGAEALPWERAMPTLASTLRMVFITREAIVVFIYLVVAIGTANTLLMSVSERTREFGVLRALGLPGARIRRMVLAEGAVLAAAGIVLGLIAGASLNLRLSTKGLDLRNVVGKNFEVGGTMIEPWIYSQWNVPAMVFFSASMAMLTLAASWYPAWRALHVDPAAAMAER